MSDPTTPAAVPVELRYATWLQWGGWVGLVSLIAAFVVYASGVLPPVIGLDRLPEFWELPAEALLQASGQKAGWAWIRLLAHGDILNLLGIALLASCSAAPLLAVLPDYLRRGDRVYALLCLLQVVVLALAASGLLGAGH